MRDIVRGIHRSVIQSMRNNPAPNAMNRELAINTLSGVPINFLNAKARRLSARVRKTTLRNMRLAHAILGDM